jgi:hypothetical protein
MIPIEHITRRKPGLRDWSNMMPRPTLEQCKKYPEMWHVRYANGHLSDMLNLTRAKDVLARLVAEYEHTREQTS